MTADVRLCFYLFVNKHIPVSGYCVAFFRNIKSNQIKFIRHKVPNIKVHKIHFIIEF